MPVYGIEWLDEFPDTDDFGLNVYQSKCGHPKDEYETMRSYRARLYGYWRSLSIAQRRGYRNQLYVEQEFLEMMQRIRRMARKTLKKKYNFKILYGWSYQQVRGPSPGQSLWNSGIQVKVIKRDLDDCSDVNVIDPREEMTITRYSLNTSRWVGFKHSAAKISKVLKLKEDSPDITIFDHEETSNNKKNGAKGSSWNTSNADQDENVMGEDPDVTNAWADSTLVIEDEGWPKLQPDEPCCSKSLDTANDDTNKTNNDTNLGLNVPPGMTLAQVSRVLFGKESCVRLASQEEQKEKDKAEAEVKQKKQFYKEGDDINFLFDEVRQIVKQELLRSKCRPYFELGGYWKAKNFGLGQDVQKQNENLINQLVENMYLAAEKAWLSE